MRVFDCFPFFNELDVLEIRLHEMDAVADAFIILESGETYGGTPKPFYLEKAMRSGRFDKFADKIVHLTIDSLEPRCVDRTTGRLREAYQRDMLMPAIASVAKPDDVVILSDCDEIPRAAMVSAGIPSLSAGPVRLKQNSYYYTVNRMVDYGNDFASRARMGLWKDVEACGTMYAFRMYQKNVCRALENAGWHFGYFGPGIEHIKTKVESLSPFLSEYKLYGDRQLVQDILNGKDLHHRRCEMPETFHHCESNDPTLPAYFLANRERFRHFTEDFYREQYKDLL